jgi:endonuclease/exonuclease/phosphatase family metal-dependent hydrolase
VGVKIITLNVELNRHHERVLALVAREAPAVLCFQEATESLLLQLADRYEAVFLPYVLRTIAGETIPEGLAVLVDRSRGEIRETREYRHVFAPGEVRHYDEDLPFLNVNYGTLLAQLGVDGEVYTIGSTHGAWTPQGREPDAGQTAAISRFVSELAGEAPHVMVGDFNVPRRLSPLYSLLTSLYTDAIPESVTSTLDPTYHRLGSLPEKAELFRDFVVDYVFTQPPYTATNVRTIAGVSDHMAVVADIHRS